MSASGDDALEMPCLGRPFQLGMLYDCRSDRPILGMTLWDADVLKKATSSKPQTASDFKVIAEDSISEKTTSMDISASLKLSLLGGLVKSRDRLSTSMIASPPSVKPVSVSSTGVLLELNSSLWRD